MAQITADPAPLTMAEALEESTFHYGPVCAQIIGPRGGITIRCARTATTRSRSHDRPANRSHALDRGGMDRCAQVGRIAAMKCYARDESKPPSERTSCDLDANHKGHHDHGGHRWSMRVNGSRRCYDCDATDYDSQWGAGLFADWPRGHHKAHGE